MAPHSKHLLLAADLNAEIKCSKASIRNNLESIWKMVVTSR